MTDIINEDKLFFLDVLQNLLRSNGIFIRVFPKDFNNIDDMFRELLSEYSTSIKDTSALSRKLNEIAHQVAESIIEVNHKSEMLLCELTNHFLIEKRDGNRRECILNYTFDKSSKKLNSNYFMLVYTSEEKEVLSKIGLNI